MCGFRACFSAHARHIDVAAGVPQLVLWRPLQARGSQGEAILCAPARPIHGGSHTITTHVSCREGIGAHTPFRPGQDACRHCPPLPAVSIDNWPAAGPEKSAEGSGTPKGTIREEGRSLGHALGQDGGRCSCGAFVCISSQCPWRSHCSRSHSVPGATHGKLTKLTVNSTAKPVLIANCQACIMAGPQRRTHAVSHLQAAILYTVHAHCTLIARSLHATLHATLHAYENAGDY